MKPQTIEQYFREKLPKEVADKAIANLKGDGNSSKPEYPVLSGLISAFTWSETPEGHKYWASIEQKYNV